MRGYVQVYTGNGKGKTTAALGIALRAAGHGLRVYIAQFCKKQTCGEHIALKKLKGFITIKQFGTGKFIKGKPSAKDIKNAQKGFLESLTAIFSGKYDIVILDEMNDAVSIGLIDVERVAEAIDSKPDEIELIITGRNASKKIIQRADLVTDMREIRHYYKNGVKARKGIEY